MKNLKKFLGSSRRLEARHTKRKSREAEEVYEFDLQHDYHHQHELDRLLEFESVHAQHTTQRLEPVLEAEQDWHVKKNNQLTATEAFEQIANLQGSNFESQPDRPKQLPAGSHGAFAHELSDLTETHLKRETIRNERARNEEEISSDAEYWEELDESPEDEIDTVLYLQPTQRKKT